MSIGIVAAMAKALGLSHFERSLLDFERGWWHLAEGASKAETIRTHLSMSPSCYYSHLSVLAERREAADYDPLVVHRVLRRKRELRRARFVTEPPRRRSPR